MTPVCGKTWQRAEGRRFPKASFPTSERVQILGVGRRSFQKGGVVNPLEGLVAGALRTALMVLGPHGLELKHLKRQVCRISLRHFEATYAWEQTRENRTTWWVVP